MKWEYQTIENPSLLSDQLLNHLGEEKWELISFVQEMSLGKMNKLVPTNYIYVFKRPIEE